MLRALRITLLVGLFVLLTAAFNADAQDIAPKASNVYYGAKGTFGKILDVYLPDEGSAPYPVVVMFAVSSGDKNTVAYLSVPQFAVSQGYAVINVSYLPTLPEVYEDAFCALAWVYANADQYGFDTSRIALYGVSWGGLTSAFLATVTDSAPYLTACPNVLPADHALRGVITNSGAFLASVDEIKGFVGAGLLNDLAQLPADRLQKTFDALSSITPDQWCCLRFENDIHDMLYRFPIFHVNKQEPPHLLVQGLDDMTVPYQSALNYATALLEQGVSVETVFDAKSGHIVDLSVYRDQMATFLKRVFQ